jgi:hypothetical protein
MARGSEAEVNYYYYLFILHRAESYGNGYLLSKAHNLYPVSTSSAFATFLVS